MPPKPKTTAPPVLPAKSVELVPVAGELTIAQRKQRMAYSLQALAEQKLIEFVKQAWHVVEPTMPFIDNWHFHAICEHLEAVSLNQIKNLLINVPPGTGKSIIVCVLWMVWEWTTRPESKFSFASYSEKFATRDSLKCRRVIESPWFKERWGGVFRLTSDQNQKTKFENNKMGAREVVSISSGTGLHPDYFVWDDPHKVKEAESEAERQNVIDWLDGVVATRGHIKGMRRVGVMQRLHAQDASGHWLEQGGVVHLCFPMRFEKPVRVVVDGKETDRFIPRMPVTPLGFQDPRTEDGQLLWPAVYTEEKILDMEGRMGQYHAAGQLQQRPTPRGGGKFKRAWFGIKKAAPKLNKMIRYWDKAGTKGGDGAKSSGVLIASFTDESQVIKAFKTQFIILDVITGRWEAAEREAIIKQTAELDRAKWAAYGYVVTWVEQEPGSGGKESAQGTVANLEGFSVQMDKVTGSKDVRCDPLASQASVGKVWLLEGTWNQEFLDEAEHFPLGKRKDQIDSAGGGYNKLATGSGAFSAADQMGVGPQQNNPIAPNNEAVVPFTRLGPGDF